MGLFALWYVPRVKRARARGAARRAQARTPQPRRTGLRGQLCSNDSNTVSSTDTPGTSIRS